jgi:hypothetical protein
MGNHSSLLEVLVQEPDQRNSPSLAQSQELELHVSAFLFNLSVEGKGQFHVGIGSKKGDN